MRVLSESRNSSGALLLIAALSLLSLPLTLLYPLPLRLVVDNVLGHSPLPRFLANMFPLAFRRIRCHRPGARDRCRG